MTNVEEIIRNINAFVKAETEDAPSLAEELPDFPGRERVEKHVEQFETIIAGLLAAQKQRYLSLLNAFTAKSDEEILEAYLFFLREEVFSQDVFIEQMTEETKAFLKMTMTEFCELIMDSLDKDVPFQVMSKRSIDWIESWSSELSEIMQLRTDNQVEKILTSAIEKGSGIDVVERELMEAEGFSRQRARTTAITEVLTASSVAHQESFAQSPAVVGKRWKHSGSKSIRPRENHMALDGTVVAVDEPFVIPGSGELAMFPRDPNLSAKERISCHCVQGPVVDEDIFGLSAEEKQAIRDEALAELNGEDSTKHEEFGILEDNHYKEIEDAEAWEEEVSPGWINDLTPREMEAIKTYTSSEYREINGYLRNTNAEQDTTLDQTIAHIKTGLEKFDLKENIVTYRGLSKNIWGIPAEMLEGMELEDKGFMSTSISKSVSLAGFTGDVEIEVRIPAGSTGAYVNRISEFDHEMEFLLTAGTKYRVISANEVNGKIKMIVEVITHGKMEG
ncbi:ADP-ribosyltransferase [Shouchella clausii]|uniref:ADP-ribosyltransferase n=1 Tax=Shouchella clausii TaxID=79880 RepID=UPI001C729FE6|nr:ADP-ribosyltransferase [Shouchella clausii]MBX0319761.1 hypothetical protein [Shouchella clausii]